MNTTHMNLFHSYTQNGSMPIENNISRGLAILLRENRSFLMLFLQFLKELNEKKNNEENKQKDKVQIDYPYDSYEVGFQTSAEEFDIVKKIIGVTLTSEDLPEFDDNGNQNGVDGKKITDIAVAYDDTLIIIEVKRNNADCNKQIREQIAKYKSTHIDITEPISSVVLNMIWPDIVQLLGRDIRLNHDRDLLTNDYRDFLLSNFPSWARSEYLSLLEPSQKEQIQFRLKTLQNLFVNYHNKNNEAEDEFYISNNDVIIDKLYYYVRLVRFDFEERIFLGELKEQPCVTINFWPGDTIIQSNYLRSMSINRTFINRRHQSIMIGSIKADVQIWPYMKFSYYRSNGQVWLSQREMDENKIDEWLSLSKKINKKIKRDAWQQDLKTIIQQNNSMFDSKELESFDKQFKAVFEEPGRAEANVSCGFEIKVSFPFETIKEMDKNGSDEALPELIDETIKKITSLLIKTDEE